MKTMKASDFKGKCLKELDNLPEEGILITKHGKPVAKVLPIKETRMWDYYGCLKTKIKVSGDIYSTGEKWNAES